MLKPTYKNRLLGEYSREELENDFLKNCEMLDTKAHEIVALEQKAQHLSQQLSKLAKDLQQQSRAPKMFSGSQAPSAFRQSQINVKELQDQIIDIQREIDAKQQKHTKILRDISYFQSIQTEKETKIKSRSLTKSGISKPTRSREEIIMMLQELLAKNTLPQIANRINSAIALLQGDYEAAEEPMRPILEHIGETTTLTQCMQEKYDLQERQQKIEVLREKLNTLRQRYETMLAKHQEMSKQYESDAVQTAVRNKEIHDLQIQKETKEREMQKIAELEIIATSLKREIEQLEEQKDQLQKTTVARAQKVQSQVMEALDKLRAEADAVNKRCAEARAANDELEKQLAEAEKERNEAAAKRREAETEFENLQDEYKTIATKYSQKVDMGQKDPFEDKRFVKFIAKMKEKGWTPKTIKEMSAETEDLEHKLSDLNTKISIYEAAEKELQEKLAKKRNKIQILEDQLKGVKVNLENEEPKGPLQMPDYTEGAPSIDFSPVNQLPLKENQTTIAILFKEFQLDRTVTVGKPSEVFFFVEFLENDPRETNHVPCDGKVFKSRLDFVVNNDFILREYITKTAVPLQLRRDREGQITEAARSELNLLPLTVCNGFSAISKIWNTRGKAVGQVKIEVSIQHPLAPPKNEDEA
ncbi:hypothetical protein TVAG_205280 [Trichomonas vaginalis G3]|uniref:RPGR-interacting protein 1 first C2 domain-containing protein n=1 Tax=Trichomonas vaginalis (strain ATCC PRA-98 / G3) TaxID=412133 RepID=A2FFQ8_TRIV3|nr:retinitis pigmentosa GTPase regulator-interacting protein family [Trichomonas vaginalis G3]EAX96242.1 hypothetical protein TVAG_205280 [Trichomonas vaginalis G3]KAI5516250.1 retinitis pigmentosa GTPase regulator-interacting protein family [Trichomonas vaginalis G3]|eukprot:XP_001309172.1 hypothetical protein [Trichomonas vaginalis G3]